MPFYLQFGRPEGARKSMLSNYERMFLDDHQHEGCKPIATIEAPDWQDARIQVEAYII